MSFISLSYLLFFPIISLIYFVLPHKYRWFLLLLGSYFFYMSWNVKYAFLMLFSTVVTYYSGKFISKVNQNKDLDEDLKIKKKKVFLFLSLFINLSILFFFKYFNFLNSSIVDLFQQFHVKMGFQNLNILLPVGISFYTFQALSYTLDVYYNKIEATRHFGKYALFVSFFPQLVAGPIERSWHLLPQFDKPVKFNYDRVKDGLALIIWGVFKKVVIANRLAIVVNTVYKEPDKFYGFELVIATIFFSFQIYTDFSSYTDIARGSAKVLGYDLMKNFKHPYFALSIPDFWRRWHISLTSWFKDYLYIPLGGNRVPKAKWYLNILIIFLVSGLWHGAAWSFVVWGFLHGIFQILDIHTKKLRYKIADYFNIKKDSKDINFLKIIWTFMLVTFAWVFFRAETIDKAVLIVKNSLTFNPWVIFDGSLYNLGLDVKDFNLSIILILGLLIVWYIEIKQNIPKIIFSQHLFVRYFIYLFLILFIIIFGYYGTNYDSAQFIYFQF